VSADDRSVPVASDDERRAARERIVQQVGWSRTGTGDDAPRIERLPGTPAGSEAPVKLAIEEEHLEVMANYGMGDVWSRPGLDLKTRALVTVAMLTALYHTDELHLHISNALNVGVSPDEIMEVILHAGLYGGLPAWTNANYAARHVFLQRGLLEP
jgi:4-carboxymuconolactone decarboxylase